MVSVYCTVTFSIIVAIPFVVVMSMTEFTLTIMIISITVIPTIIIDPTVIIIWYAIIIRITIARKPNCYIGVWRWIIISIIIIS